MPEAKTSPHAQSATDYRSTMFDLETLVNDVTCLADISAFLVEHIIGAGNKEVTAEQAEMLAYAAYETQQKAEALADFWRSKNVEASELTTSH